MRTLLTLIAAGMLGLALPMAAVAVDGVTGLTTTTSTTTTSTAPTGTTTTATTTTATTTTATTTKSTTTKSTTSLTSPTSLGLSVGTSPGPLAPFAPGNTATTSSSLDIVASLGSWTLTASDAGTASPAPGHLVRSSSCTKGSPYLADPLALLATPSVGTSNGTQQLGAAPVTIAAGPATLAGTVSVAFSQVIGTAESMQAGCAYSLTVAFTLS